MRFDISVAPNGYAWWYIDAISDDGEYGLTIIAFIGSVFSPYYAWSKKRDPFNHCALNVALYSPHGNRWAMTERSRRTVTISTDQFTLGASALNWNGRQLKISIDEMTAPIPGSIKGEIIVETDFLNPTSFCIDNAGRHRWRPISPAARVEARFTNPNLNWSGRGYLDMNDGDEPLERAFRYWDWSRAELGPDSTAILYNCDLWNGDRRSLALKFANNECVEMAPPPETEMAPTKIWRIRRRTRADADTPANIVKTLEDTPFYSRSIIESSVFGQPRFSMHESFSGRRFRSPIVKTMLAFRMPRLG